MKKIQIVKKAISMGFTEKVPILRAVDESIGIETESDDEEVSSEILESHLLQNYGDQEWAVRFVRQL